MNAKPITAAQLTRIDRELLGLLQQRVEIAQQLARKRAGESLPQDVIESEQSSISRLIEKSRGTLPDGFVRRVFCEVLAGSRALDPPIRVAYLGPEHTFSHQAALQRFGDGGALVPVGSIAAVFEEIDRDASTFGVVPLENSTDGRVTDTLDCFARTRVKICGELPLRIRHCLVGLGPRSGIKSVASKPQALSQCRNWIAQHLPQAEPHAVGSTAEAARLTKADPTVAAIASAEAAKHLELLVLSKNIEDQKDNITRFAVLGRQSAEKTGNDKTSLMFEVAHQPGALADAMAIFKRNKLNMTWIESFPIPSSGGRYLFFVEFVGHQAELRSRRAVASLEKKAKRLELLGSYPQTEPIG